MVLGSLDPNTGCCVSRRCRSVSFFLSSTHSFGSVFLFGPAFSFSLAISFSFAWLWSRVFDQGWSSSEVPRRGSQPLGLVSQTHESTTHLSPTLHKFPSPTPHPTSRTLAINPDWFRQAKFAKRACCGYIVLRSDPTGSGRTEGGRKDRVRRTAIDCPHQNACRRDESETRGDLRRPEPNRSFRAFRRTSDRDEGELSNISSEVVEYKYTKYIY